MAFFSDLAQHVAVLSELCGHDITSDRLPDAVARLSGDDAVNVVAEASALVRAAEKLRIAASGVLAAASTREHGHSGVAQTRGHRSPVSLVQELMGSTRADAVKHVRLGESLLAASSPTTTGTGETDRGDAPPAEPWHAPLGRALLAGALTSAQHDAILRGLGEPPTGADDEPSATATTAWSVAAEQLVAEAAERTVEELARTARTVRDLLDPDGAERRFDERFERRSWRTWTDRDGVLHGSIVFDDLMGAWMRTILDAALRPRRGGPRFVDPDEKARARELVDDPRTNDQLAYDLLTDTLRAGALADAETVFGTRQAGVRVVVSAGSLAASAAKGAPGVAIVEDDQTSLPAWLAAQQSCETGTLGIAVDPNGDPLRLGREQRLFSSTQRVALAIRDGGCRWRGCDRPASSCEAHHIDEYARGGRTDVDRGVLLCRFHHMQLHHGGWRIARDGSGDFVLHPPGGAAPITLRPRLALTYAWAGVDPPPRRFRPAA